jgi:hypothetical protein
MKNKTYDKLKFIAQVILPLVATFYVTLAELWGLPFSTEISGTIMAVDTLMGGILMKLSNNYNKKVSE